MDYLLKPAANGEWQFQQVAELAWVVHQQFSSEDVGRDWREMAQIESQDLVDTVEQFAQEQHVRFRGQVQMIRTVMEDTDYVSLTSRAEIWLQFDTVEHLIGFITLLSFHGYYCNNSEQAIWSYKHA